MEVSVNRPGPITYDKAAHLGNRMEHCWKNHTDPTPNPEIRMVMFLVAPRPAADNQEEPPHCSMTSTDVAG